MRTSGDDAHPVIVFDGECCFCNDWVNWIIARDHKCVFRFASLQSPYAQSRLHGVSVESIHLLEGERVVTHSTAVLRICKYLPMPWRLFYGFILVPHPLRDKIYNWVALHRHTFFWLKQGCGLPSEEMRERIVK